MSGYQRAASKTLAISRTLEGCFHFLFEGRFHFWFERGMVAIMF